MKLVGLSACIAPSPTQFVLCYMPLGYLMHSGPTHCSTLLPSVTHSPRVIEPCLPSRCALNDLSLARIFGCRCYALPTSRRPAKLDIHACISVFLGYDSSWKHPRYFDLTTRVVKTAKHLVFDESKGMHKDPPPYMRLFHTSDNSVSRSLQLADPCD